MHAYPIDVRDREEAKKKICDAIDLTDTFVGQVWCIASDNGALMAVTGCGAKAQDNAERLVNSCLALDYMFGSLGTETLRALAYESPTPPLMKPRHREKMPVHLTTDQVAQALVECGMAWRDGSAIRFYFDHNNTVTFEQLAKFIVAVQP